MDRAVVVGTSVLLSSVITVLGLNYHSTVVPTIKRTWGQLRRYFTHPKRFPPVDPKAINVLLLCHGTDTRPFTGIIDYTVSNVYTVDINPDVNPTVVRDLSGASGVKFVQKELVPGAFDCIVLFTCRCCTRQVVEPNAEPLINAIKILLKPGGSLYVKSPNYVNQSLPDGYWDDSNGYVASHQTNLYGTTYLWYRNQAPADPSVVKHTIAADYLISFN